MSPKRRIANEPTREDQTRADIIEAAKRLAQKHGLHKVTMDDIASALGKKKSFLYYYYPGRRELIEAAIQAELAEMQQYVRKAVAGRRGAAEQIRTFVVARMETVLQRAEQYGSAAISTLLQGVEAGTDFTSLLEMRKAFDREEEIFVAGLLRQGIQQGAFRPLSNTVIGELTYFLLSSLRGVELEMALSRDPRPSPVPRMSGVLDIFFRGLAL
jgi:AcrR family transcriptional regulator